MITTDLKGKTAFVSGSTSGIGKAIAFQLARCGCNLVLIGRDASRLERILNEIVNQYDVTINRLVADFNYPESMLRTISEFHISSGIKIEILINCVRGPVPTEIENITLPQMTETFNRHVVSSQSLASLFLSDMKIAKYGRIINIIDTVFKTPYPGLALSFVRSAEAAWCKALSVDLAAFGITVNSILPGPTDTPGLTEVIRVLAEMKGVSEETYLEESLASLPIKRLAQPEEIAYVALFLASPGASYITGTMLNADGGFSPSI